MTPGELAPDDLASSASLSPGNRVLGAAFVILAVLFQVLWLGRPAMLLSVGLVVAYGLWSFTPWRMTASVRRAFFLGPVLFVAHAAEELLTGFPAAFPDLFGQAPWSETRFLVFNGVWLTVFALAAYRAAGTHPLPALVVLFFAFVGGLGNGVVHLALVVQRGAYFPGAWTAPLCLCLGVWLFRGLYASKARRVRSVA